MHGELFWGLPVIIYLFLGGLSAGAVIISGHVYHLAGGGNFGRFGYQIAKYGALIAPLPVMIGTSLIIWELGRMFRVVNLFKVVNLSPMNIGSWLLSFFIVLTVAYAATFLPKNAGPGDKLEKFRKTLAWCIVPVAYGVAVYTGVMLGATPGRPFWNSSILPAIFLLSAISAGIAAIILVSTLFRKKTDDPQVEADHHEGMFLLLAIDTVVIALELVSLFILIIFGYLTVESARAAVSLVLWGGSMAVAFWGGIVFLALVLPLVIELPMVAPKMLYGKPFRPPMALEIGVATCILVGGFILRYLVVVAGQISHPVGI
jgi:formate-dependent nitrite reductase membrane component NrfD